MSSKRDYNYIERLILESFIQGEEDGQDLDMYLHSKIDEIEKEIEKIIYQFEDNGDIYIFDSLEINLEFNSFSSLRE
ncbi:MAG: hypothetical protein ACPG5P_05995, partial [Saprospiraceae bacterium]